MAGREVAENFAGAGVAVGGLEGEFAVIAFAGRHEEDAGFGSAEPEGELDGIGEAGFDALADHEAVDDDLDPVFGISIERDLGDFPDLAVEADADEALPLEIAEQALWLRGFLLGDGGEDDELGAFGLAGERGDDFRRPHAGHGFPRFGIMRDSGGGPEDAEVIVNFRGGGDGGSRGKTADALFDGDGGVEPLDGIDIRLF